MQFNFLVTSVINFQKFPSFCVFSFKDQSKTSDDVKIMNNLILNFDIQKL